MVKESRLRHDLGRPGTSSPPDIAIEVRRAVSLIDDLEVEACQQCGERYHHATTLDAMDELLESGQSVVKEHLHVGAIGMPA